MAGLDFEEEQVDLDDPDARQELLLLSPSVLVPRLTHGEVDGLGHARHRRISERDRPGGAALAGRPAARAHCRAVSGEIHSGFYNLRSALPMNLKARHPKLQDLLRRAARRRAHPPIWTECLETLWRAVPVRRADGRRRDVRAGLHPLPHLCGRHSTPLLQRYCETIFDWPLMQEWTEGALAEPDEIVELEVEF